MRFWGFLWQVMKTAFPEELASKLRGSRDEGGLGGRRGARIRGLWQQVCEAAPVVCQRQPKGPFSPLQGAVFHKCIERRNISFKVEEVRRG